MEGDRDLLSIYSGNDTIKWLIWCIQLSISVHGNDDNPAILVTTEGRRKLQISEQHPAWGEEISENMVFFLFCHKV